MPARLTCYVIVAWVTAVAASVLKVRGLVQSQFGDMPVRSEPATARRVAALTSSKTVKRLRNAEMDVIVPVHRTSCVVEKAIQHLNKYFGPRRILVATNASNCPTLVNHATNVQCFDEDALMPGLTKRNIALRIHDLRQKTNRRRKTAEQSKILNMHITGNGGHSTAGWWLQQFVKFSFVNTPLLADFPLSETFLIWDSDLILLDHFDAINADGRMPLMAGGKAHALIGDVCPYGYSYRALTGHDTAIAPGNRGYIPHHMVVHKPFLVEMLQAFQGKSVDEWFWRIMDAACGTENMARCTCGFSEYTSYATWVKAHHPEAIVDIAENFTRVTGPDTCCPLEADKLLQMAHNQKGGGRPFLFVGLEQGGCKGFVRKPKRKRNRKNNL